MRPSGAGWAAVVGFLSTLGPAILAYATLIAWGWLTWMVFQNAPPGKMAGPVTVKASEGPKVLGYLELGQRSGAKSAAAEHLLVVNRGGQWFFGNKSQNKRVLLTTTRYEARFAERWTIAEGDRISLPGVELDVAKLSADSLTLREAKSGREIVWDGTARRF